jgi:hypothetical protein
MMTQHKLGKFVVVFTVAAMVPLLTGTMCGTNNGGMTPQP